MLDAKAAKAAEKVGHSAKRHKRPQSRGKWWKPVFIPRWLVMLAEHAAGWAFVLEQLVAPAHGTDFLLLSALCIPIGLYLMSE